MNYLRVTAEGSGDNGKTLHHTLDSPQVHSLHPRPTDKAVMQGGQHYLEAAEVAPVREAEHGGGVGQFRKGAKGRHIMVRGLKANRGPRRVQRPTKPSQVATHYGATSTV